MKYLKYLLFLIGILAAILLIVGLINPTSSYQSEITVNKTAEEAWAVMNDESKLGEWLEGYKRAELISGEKGKVGAVSNIYFDQKGEEMSIEETIKDLQSGKKIAMDFNSQDFFTMEYEMLFEEKDGKTVLKSNTINKGSGIIAKAMMVFMKGTMIEQEDKNMTSLKKVIESNTTNYFRTIEQDTTLTEIKE